MLYLPVLHRGRGSASLCCLYGHPRLFQLVCSSGWEGLVASGTGDWSRGTGLLRGWTKVGPDWAKGARLGSYWSIGWIAMLVSDRLPKSELNWGVFASECLTA